jgi:cytochrome d ubiquinol oxidase subunit I
MVEQTTRGAPYIIGGEWTSEGEVEGGIRIPNGLSILAGNSPQTEVKGLNDYPREDWPMLFINTLFEVKLLLVGVIVVLLHSRKLSAKLRTRRFGKIMLLALITTGPLVIVVVELGWMVAEFGRQPFVVNGYLRTTDAFSASTGIGQWGYIFPIMFVVLFVATSMALWLMFKRKGKLTAAKELL